MEQKRILHIAVENFAGLPYRVVREERAYGLRSRLVTLYRTSQEFPDEFSLELPFLKGNLMRKVRHSTGSTSPIGTSRRTNGDRPPLWSYPKGSKLFFDIRDMLWSVKIKKSGVLNMLSDADIVVLDGGLGFLRSGRYVLKWAEERGALVSVFYGSDLRNRGVIPWIERATKLWFTMEFDHRYLHPDIEWLPFPFDTEGIPERTSRIGETPIRIGHSPTKRAAKGSDRIIAAVKELAKEYPVELVLIEGVSYREALRMKASCHIFVDQLGELGYGVSALEALAMGIPTTVQLKDDLEQALGEHPFVNVSARNIEEKLATLIEDKEQQEELSQKGMKWVVSFHSAKEVVKKMIRQYEDKGWL